MTSSRPRGVISRLSSRGGTETTNVTFGRPTRKVRTVLALLTGMTSSVYKDPYICAYLHHCARAPHVKSGAPAAACGETRHNRNRMLRCSRWSKEARSPRRDRGPADARRRTSAARRSGAACLQRSQLPAFLDRRRSPIGAVSPVRESAHAADQAWPPLRSIPPTDSRTRQEAREDFRRRGAAARHEDDGDISAVLQRISTGGRLDPRALQSLWTLKPEKPDLVAALATAVRDNNLPQAMERLQPQQPEYRELQRALVRYRAISAKGGWPSFPTNTRLKPNQQSPAVPSLRQRLAIEGDLDPSHENNPSPVFDDDRRRRGETLRRAASHRAGRHRRCRNR